MPKADSGGYYDHEEPASPGDLYRRETHEESRIRQLRAELEGLAVTLEHRGLIDLPIESVADALARKAAIEYIINETERTSAPCHRRGRTAQARRGRAPVERAPRRGGVRPCATPGDKAEGR